MDGYFLQKFKKLKVKMEIFFFFLKGGATKKGHGKEKTSRVVPFF